MREPTIRDVDALVGPATPHFAYQLRARVRELIDGLPTEHEVRRHGEAGMELLDRLGHASSKAEDGGHEPRSRLGWEQLPSSAPADAPLPRR
ncbi:MAG: hypothetical protein ABR569_01195 [Gaiellaceae bacterium]